MIHPKNYTALKEGAVLWFQHLGGWEQGRLLYCSARKNYHLDKDGNPTKKYDWVAHRCGYEPLRSRVLTVNRSTVRVFSCHLEAGWFTVAHKPT